MENSNTITQFVEKSFDLNKKELETLPLDEIKLKVKKIISNNRWVKEVSGFPLIIQGQKVTIDTKRETRLMYFQSAAMLPDNSTILWKFPETHLNLTVYDLNLIIYSGIKFIEELFDEEYNKYMQVNNASTLEDILAIHIEF